MESQRVSQFNAKGPYFLPSELVIGRWLTLEFGVEADFLVNMPPVWSRAIL